jgi:hypothetical protein
MVIINTKNNFVWECVSKVWAAKIIGVSRNTVANWEKKRNEDGTFQEIYNNFTIYFNTTTHKALPRGKPNRRIGIIKS